MTVLSKELKINKNIPYSGAMIYRHSFLCKLQRNECLYFLFYWREREQDLKMQEKKHNTLI